MSYIPVVLSPKIKERRIELQNTIVRGQIILGSEPETDARSVDRLVSVFSKDKCLSLAEKQLAMRQYIENSINPKTFGISYMGKLYWCGMDQYIEDLHAYIVEKHTPNMLLIEVMTVREYFSINCMQSDLDIFKLLQYLAILSIIHYAWLSRFHCFSRYIG